MQPPDPSKPPHPAHHPPPAAVPYPPAYYPPPAWPPPQPQVADPFAGIDRPAGGVRFPRETAVRVPAIFHVAAWMFVLTWPFVLGGCMAVRAKIVDTNFLLRPW